MRIECCKDCQERYPACWGTCPKYLEARAEWERHKKQLHDEKVITSVQYHAHNMFVAQKERKEKQRGL